MMRIVPKSGVNLLGLHPNVLAAIYVAAEIYWDEAAEPLVVTSGWDGGHSRRSLHYQGMAVDLRTKAIDHRGNKITGGLPDLATKKRVVARLARDLGPGFDVVLEKVGKDHEHIHVEWDDGKAIRDAWVRHIMLGEPAPTLPSAA